MLKELEVVAVEPISIVPVTNRTFIDFGRDAFGWLELEIDSPDARTLEIHLGERADGDSVHRKPGGTIRYVKTTLAITSGQRTYRVQTPPDKRNTTGEAICVPEKFGVILPFRYVEFVNPPPNFAARQMRVQYPFDDNASSFTSSERRLNDVWELCKYSIKATTAFGIYVDGDRERIPYEADAYINQLSHYCVDDEYALARHTHEYLLEHPTWPTEWWQHSILMAHADWLYTGDVGSVRQNYFTLRDENLLLKYARDDGLLDTSKLRDIVDWPAGERDGYVMSPVNTVVNAFHFRTLVQMSEIAGALGRQDDEKLFAREASRVREAFNAKLFDAERGVYVDGENLSHASLHANLFALAFGLVPEDRKPRVIKFIKSRGMACSVYPAQFLLEALFENGQADYAIKLMTSDSQRSWLNMIRAGATITTEAWDTKFKPNQDWNHAWGAAPANIIPRYVLGVRPITPGFNRVMIQPQLGPLTHVQGVVPSPRGPISVHATRDEVRVDIPGDVTAKVVLPWGQTATLRGGRRAFRR